MKTAIIGGGISGLSLAYFLLEKNHLLDVTVFESEERLGGKIWTDRHNGYLLESAVNGFLDNRPKTLELSEKLKLSPLRSSGSARKRFIFTRGRLNHIPDSPPAFFRSNILSLKGRVRILYELFAPIGEDNDETLSSFAIRRLGKEAYETLIDPMASGIYAGDSTQLSLKSCFPKIYTLERNYGSLIKGMMKMKKEAKKTGKEVTAGPGGVLTSFQEGMESFTVRLRDALGSDKIRTRRKALSLEKSEFGYTIHFDGYESVNAEKVILATPAYTTSKIIMELDRPIAKELEKISYPAVTVLCLGFKKDLIRHDLQGFGFLIPFKEGKKILGTLWDSSIFPNRAPEGHVLLRTMIGGARASDEALKDDKDIKDITFNELSDIIGIKGDPDLVKIYRHEKAIPQYNIGHQEILKSIDEILKKHSGLYFHGNAYGGIGFNDCIENSFNLAIRIMSEISEMI